MEEMALLSLYMFEKIRKLIAEGHNNSEIARKLGIDRKTVRKYRNSNTPPKYSPRTSRKPLDNFDEYRSRVLALLTNNKDDPCNPNFSKNSNITVSDLYELLSADGYSGSERTLSRRVKQLRDSQPKERFFQQQYSPGEQSQLDFKESIEIPFKNGNRKINLFFGTLPYSDRFFIKGFTYKKYEAFIDGLHSFFNDIGGMTENIRIDNLSPCVKKVLSGNKRLYTQSFLKAIDYYGFNVLPCAPGKGNHKGDVERDIGTHARKIKSLIKIHGLCFDDLIDFNSWLADYISTRQTDQAKAKLLVERSKLRAVPKAEESILNKVEYFRVSSYGTIYCEESTYSIPDAFIGQTLKTVISAEEVKFFHLDGNKKLVASHPRLPRGCNSVKIEHVIFSLIRKPGALTRWKHRDIFFKDKNCKRLFDLLVKISPETAEKEFLKTMNLVQHTTFQEITTAIEIILETKTENPFEDIKGLIFTEGSYPDGKQAIIVQPLITVDLSQYDFLIPS